MRRTANRSPETNTEGVSRPRKIMATAEAPSSVSTSQRHWSNQTIADAIQAAQKLPGVDTSKTLVIGISEGGIVAMRVSNVSPRVTHAASLSGGGPVYLFHLAEFMRNKQLDAEKEVYACWSDILKDPDSATKFCWGQTYRQWSSFMK